MVVSGKSGAARKGWAPATLFFEASDSEGQPERRNKLRRRNSHHFQQGRIRGPNTVEVAVANLHRFFQSLNFEM
jgi:hypothetical protein